MPPLLEFYLTSLLFCTALLAEVPGPCTGPSVKGADASTLTGKVMCGYQGWSNAEGDGADRGFTHWTKRRGPPAPGNAKTDLWPDVSDLTVEERFATGCKHADGRVGEVFSSFMQATVLRHFQWMRDYGIDGAFVQRFPTDLRDASGLRHGNIVLEYCREGANCCGRAFDGLPGDFFPRLTGDGAKLLRGELPVTAEPPVPADSR
jgi:hypothetical protein